MGYLCHDLILLSRLNGFFNQEVTYLFIVITSEKNMCLGLTKRTFNVFWIFITVIISWKFFDDALFFPIINSPDDYIITFFRDCNILSNMQFYKYAIKYKILVCSNAHFCCFLNSLFGFITSPLVLKHLTQHLLSFLETMA